MGEITYTPQRINILVGSKDHPVSLSVFALVASNGLAYFRCLNEQGKNKGYVITHVASGRRVIPPVFRICTPKKCREIIALLDPLTDWHQTEKRLLETVRFPAVNQVLVQTGFEPLVY